MSTVSQREIPLSDTPRGQRLLKIIPTFASLAEKLGYSGDFSVVATRIVALHVRKTWGLAMEIADDELEMELEHDMLNEYDRNAVAAYVTDVGGERRLVGYVDAEAAPVLACALDQAAVLKASPCGQPYAGGDSKGGSLSIIVSLDDLDHPNDRD